MNGLCHKNRPSPKKKQRLPQFLPGTSPKLSLESDFMGFLWDYTNLNCLDRFGKVSETGNKSVIFLPLENGAIFTRAPGFRSLCTRNVRIEHVKK